MKKITTFALILLSLKLSAQTFGFGSIGLVCGEAWNRGIKKDFAPQTFAFTIGAEYQTGKNNYNASEFTPHLTIGSGLVLMPVPRIDARIGVKIGFFQPFIGGADLISPDLHPLKFSHWFGSMYGARIIIGDGYVETEKFDKSIKFNIGARVAISR